MTLTAAFFKMVRLPNLLFIILTQTLFQVCIYHPIYYPAIPGGDTMQFMFLTIASVCIAAAGYIINDYFDINIDLINKPDKLIINRFISRRWALVWHLVLSFVGIVFTVAAVDISSQWYLIIANFLCVLLLWFYSARFKKDVLIGNIVISILTAWTLLVLFFAKYSFIDAFSNADIRQLKLFRFAMLYAGFAFVISLIREAIKDIEDLPGDARYGCKTMPVVWGVNAVKIYIGIWLSVLSIMLLLIQFYILQFGWWLAVAYCVVCIMLPLVYVFIKLAKAYSTPHYSQLSALAKWIMLSGILSMIMFYIYL